MMLSGLRSALTGDYSYSNNLMEYAISHPPEAVVKVFLENTVGLKPEFVTAESLLMQALIGFLRANASQPEHSNFMLEELLQAGANPDPYNKQGFEDLFETGGKNFGQIYKNFKIEAGNLYELIFKSCLKRLQNYVIPLNPLKYIAEHDGMDGDGLGVRYFVYTIIHNTKSPMPIPSAMLEITLLTAITYYLFYENTATAVKSLYLEEEDAFALLYHATEEPAHIINSLQSLKIKAPGHPAIKYFNKFKAGEKSAIQALVRSINSRIGYWMNINDEI